MARDDRRTEPAPHEPLPDIWTHPRRVAAIGRSAPAEFDLVADAAALRRIADFLGIEEVGNLRFRGRIAPLGQRDMRLEGRLTASATQACVVSGEPVVQTIDAAVARDYLHDWSPGVDLDDETEEETEPLSDLIDPGAVAVEELALALDPFPHAEGIEPVEMRAGPPGAEPLDEDAVKPFAGLAALRARMGGEEP